MTRGKSKVSNGRLLGPISVGGSRVRFGCLVSVVAGVFLSDCCMACEAASTSKALHTLGLGSAGLQPGRGLLHIIDGLLVRLIVTRQLESVAELVGRVGPVGAEGEVVHREGRVPGGVPLHPQERWEGGH